MTEKARTRQDIQQELVVKALKDDAYRQRLKAKTMILPPRPAEWSAEMPRETMRQYLQRHVPLMPVSSRRVAEVQAQVIAQAWDNETFQQRLLEDATRVVEQFLGVTLDDANQYVILPPALEEMELTDAQLEHVGEVVSATMITLVTTVDLRHFMPTVATW